MSIISKQTLRTLGVAIAASVLSCVPVFAEDVQVKDEWETRVAADVETYANIRSEATTKSEKTGVLPKGARADVLLEGEKWTLVVSGDIRGYIRNDLLVFGEEAEDLYEEHHGEAEETMLAMTAKEYKEYKRASLKNVSDSDLDLMAAIIQCEAGGESHVGKVAVGAVVINRVMSDRFPDTISEVIYQSGQFTPAASGKLANVLAEGARSDCYDAAIEAFSGENPVGDCLFFNSGHGRGIQIGNQHFF